jgi:hypothetical protein
VALIRAKDVTEATPRTLADTGPRDAYGMTADDQSLYFISAERFGDINDSTISKMPIAGGTIVSLVEHTAGAFPIMVFKGFVYYMDGFGVHRVPVNSLSTGEVASELSEAFRPPPTPRDTVMYWTDPTHGGLVRAGWTEGSSAC